MIFIRTFVVLAVHVIAGYSMDKVAEFCDYGLPISFSCKNTQIISIKSVRYQFDYFYSRRQRKCQFLQHPQACNVTIGSVSNAEFYIGFLSTFCNQRKTCEIRHKDIKEIFPNVVKILKKKDACKDRIQDSNNHLVTRVEYSCIKESDVIDVCSDANIDVLPPKYITHSYSFTKEKTCNCLITGNKIMAQVLNLQTQGSDKVHVTALSRKCQVNLNISNEMISSCKGELIKELRIKTMFYKSIGSRFLVKISSFGKGDIGAIKIKCGDSYSVLGELGQPNISVISTTLFQSTDITTNRTKDETCREEFIVTIVIIGTLLLVILILVSVIASKKRKKKSDYANLAGYRTAHAYQLSRRNIWVSDDPSYVSAFDSHSYVSVEPDNAIHTGIANSESGGYITVVRNSRTNNTVAQTPPNVNGASGNYDCENTGAVRLKLTNIASDGEHVFSGAVRGLKLTNTNRDIVSEHDHTGAARTLKLSNLNSVNNGEHISGNGRNLNSTNSDCSYVLPNVDIQSLVDKYESGNHLKVDIATSDLPNASYILMNGNHSARKNVAVDDRKVKSGASYVLPDPAGNHRNS